MGLTNNEGKSLGLVLHCERIWTHELSASVNVQLYCVFENY